MLVNSVAASLNIFFLFRFMKKYFREDKSSSGWLKSYFNILIAASLINGVFFLPGLSLALLLLALITPFLGLWVFIILHEKLNFLNAFTRTFAVFGVEPGKAFGLFLILAVTGTIYYFMLNSPLAYFYYEIINWNLNLSHETVRIGILFLMTFVSFFAIQLILPMMFIGSGLLYYSIVEISEASDLKKRINSLLRK